LFLPRKAQHVNIRLKQYSLVAEANAASKNTLKVGVGWQKKGKIGGGFPPPGFFGQGFNPRPPPPPPPSPARPPPPRLKWPANN